MTIDSEKVIGGKRKNGHKMDCGCHICKNMEAKAHRHGYAEDLEKEQERKNGYQKKNGHKSTCGCPICNNMKNKSKTNKTKINKKSNGHKSTCGCPICKNMGKIDEDMIPTETETEKKIGGRKNTKRRRSSNGHKPNCCCPICKNMKKNKTKRH